MYSSTRDQRKTRLIQNSLSYSMQNHLVERETLIRLGIKTGNNRILVYHRDAYVDIDAMNIKDLSGLYHIGKQTVKSLRNTVIKVMIENEILNE